MFELRHKRMHQLRTQDMSWPWTVRMWTVLMSVYKFIRDFFYLTKNTSESFLFTNFDLFRKCKHLHAHVELVLVALVYI